MHGFKRGLVRRDVQAKRLVHPLPVIGMGEVQHGAPLQLLRRIAEHMVAGGGDKARDAIRIDNQDEITTILQQDAVMALGPLKVVFCADAVCHIDANPDDAALVILGVGRTKLSLDDVLSEHIMPGDRATGQSVDDAGGNLALSRRLPDRLGFIGRKRAGCPSVDQRIASLLVEGKKKNGRYPTTAWRCS